MDRTLLEQSSVFQEFLVELRKLRKEADEFFHQAKTTETLWKGQGACEFLDQAIDIAEGKDEEEEHE